VNVTRYQVELCVYGLRQLIDLSPLTRVKVLPELRGLLQQLDDILHVTFEPESELVSAAEQLMLNGPIGTTEAALILECSSQWVRHIAKDLGGQRTSSGWVFDRQTVMEYAQERRKR
jgi:hypothetical protein